LPEWRTCDDDGQCHRDAKETIAIGFVASTMYARLPGLIRAFRKAAPDVELSLVEMGSIDQIAALKEGLIDVGFGRIVLMIRPCAEPSCEKSNWS
jgi:DNA-binding transcriptional LysR family regulator